MSGDSRPHDPEVHAVRGEAAEEAVVAQAARAESARARADAARARGDDAAAAFQEDVAAFHEVHRAHQEEHAALEAQLAGGGTVIGFERAHGALTTDEAPEPPRPPHDHRGDATPTS